MMVSLSLSLLKRDRNKLRTRNISEEKGLDHDWRGI
jgi:hypothetical protein